LTEIVVKATLTTVPDAAPTPPEPHPEHAVMAMLLTTNAQLVADVLRGEGDHSSHQVMRAIAATRALSLIVDDTLRALVAQARAAGSTWAEVGEVLHVTRQAAFQRFGGAQGSTAAEGVPTPLDGAGAMALTLLRQFLDRQWDEARARFTTRMLEAISVELLQSVRAKVDDRVGAFQAFGAPEISVLRGITVVEVPMSFERGDGFGRVTLNADGQVTGMLVRPAEDQ
jgi:hypothetical protein